MVGGGATPTAWKILPQQSLNSVRTAKREPAYFFRIFLRYAEGWICYIVYKNKELLIFIRQFYSD